MNKAELVAQVARRSGQAPEKTRLVVDLTFELIREALSRGEEVRVAGFGSFRRRYRPSRTGRHPRTGQVTPVAGRFVPSFVASDRLKRAISIGRHDGEPAVSRLGANRDRPPIRSGATQAVHQPSGQGEQLTRRLGVHVYLPNGVVIGDLFVSEPSLLDFLHFAGTCLYLHTAVAFPYQEAIPPVRAREIAVRKDDILFLVARAAFLTEPATTELTEVHAACGPFVVRGKSPVPWAALLGEVSQPGQRFIVLWQATVYGPGRANFAEPSLVLGLHRVTLVGA